MLTIAATPRARCVRPTPVRVRRISSAGCLVSAPAGLRDMTADHPLRVSGPAPLGAFAGVGGWRVRWSGDGSFRAPALALGTATRPEMK